MDTSWPGTLPERRRAANPAPVPVTTDTHHDHDQSLLPWPGIPKPKRGRPDAAPVPAGMDKSWPGAPAPKRRRADAQGRAVDSRSLLGGDGWPPASVLDMALEIICAAADSDVQRFVPVTSLLFAPSSGPQNNTRYIAWLKGLVINNEENTFILLPLCIQGSHGSHWTLACLEWPSKTAACYDSNPSPSPTSRRNETMETHVRAFITSFLAIDDSDWQITLAACPHQRDESSPSCGISVIANATHLVLGRSLPAHAYHAGFWRSALACLAPGGTNEDGQALWPYTKTMDDHVAAASPSQSEISEVAVRTVVSTEAPVSRALTLLKEALAERRHVLGELRVLNALVETCRQAINPLGEDNKVLNGEMNTTAQRTVPGELSKYPTPQHILSQCPEMPGSDAGAVIVAAKIAEYEKAGSDTEKEKEKTRADGEKRWNRHRARMAQFIVVERLGARVDRAMMEALACVERLEEIQTKATKHVS